MKDRIIEIVELGQPQSLIQRENAHITELIKTDLLIEELNEQLRLYNVVRSAFIDVKKAQEEFSIACKKYVESKPYQDMIKALKRAGAF